MIVSSIKQQKKRADRFSVYIDGKYVFSLSESGLLESRLSIGKEISSSELSSLKKEAVEDKLYYKVLYYLSLRPRSEWEVLSYLKRNKADEAITNKILNKLSDSDLLNDRAFAHSWMENRALLKPISRRRLIYELKTKRIDKEIIAEVVESTEFDETIAIKQIISQKRRQSRYQDNLKLMQYLSRQGFNYSDIKEALKND